MGWLPGIPDHGTAIRPLMQTSPSRHRREAPQCNTAPHAFDAFLNPGHHPVSRQRDRTITDMGDVLEFLPTPATAQGVQHYVRVTRDNHRGYVEFQFAIGDPSLYLDMTLPPQAFAEFCARHAVVHLTAAQAAAVDSAVRRWHAGQTSEDQHVD